MTSETPEYNLIQDTNHKLDPISKIFAADQSD
jgi:hypothetical protein